MLRIAHIYTAVGVIKHMNCIKSNLNRTWLDEIAWLHWLDAKLPNTLKFFSSNKKPVTADFLPSSWLLESHIWEENQVCLQKHDSSSVLIKSKAVTYLENMAFRRTRIKASFKDMLTFSRGWRLKREELLNNGKIQDEYVLSVCLLKYLDSF